jgi:hypothetical protein
MDLIPVLEAPTPELTAAGDPIKVPTTSHELFYSVKPNLRIFFPFGAVVYYHHSSDWGRGERPME